MFVKLCRNLSNPKQSSRRCARVNGMIIGKIQESLQVIQIRASGLPVGLVVPTSMCEGVSIANWTVTQRQPSFFSSLFLCFLFVLVGSSRIEEAINADFQSLMKALPGIHENEMLANKSAPSAFPVTLRSAPGCGRFVVSTRKISAGEIIFRAAPFAIAIKHVRHTCACCLKCFLPSPSSSAFPSESNLRDSAPELASFCSLCREAWYCNDDEKAAHSEIHNLECALLKRIASFTQLSLYMRTELKVAVRSVVTHHLASVKAESDDNREKTANSLASQEHRISAVCLPTFEDLLSLVSNRYVFPCAVTFRRYIITINFVHLNQGKAGYATDFSMDGSGKDSRWRKGPRHLWRRSSF